MNESFTFTPKLCTGLFSLVIGVLAWADPQTTRAVDTNSVQAAKPPKKTSKKTKKEVTGAELYAIHCNRCHPERYAPERTDVQWKTILTHMRVRVNLPAQQAQSILKFLQEDSGK